MSFHIARRKRRFEVPEPGRRRERYAEELDLTYIQGISKDSKVNRTFILAESERDKVSKKKYIYNKEIIKGKHVIIIDDSIVRGITMRNLVHSIFDNGALGVHFKLSYLTDQVFYLLFMLSDDSLCFFCLIH